MAKSRIIKEFAGGKVSVEIALKQLKVLLMEFDKPEMLKWVNSELQGYEQDDILPEYRMLSGNLVGNFMNYNIKCTHIGIPLIASAPDNLVELCTEVKLYESLASLETLTMSEREIGKQISSSYLPYIQKFSAISMTALLNASVEISKTQIKNVFSRVENMVLDILLLLEKEFGNLDELDMDMSLKSEEEIDSIVNHILVMIYNDYSITIGDNNKMKDTNILTM